MLTGILILILFILLILYYIIICIILFFQIFINHFLFFLANFRSKSDVVPTEWNIAFVYITNSVC